MPDIYHGETDQPPLHGYRGEAPAVVERWPCGRPGVRRRDALRAEYVLAHLNRLAGDPYAYDLLLNSGRLGEEACADLIAQAARTKLLHADLGSPCPDQER